jgi:ribonuclease HI
VSDGYLIWTDGSCYTGDRIGSYAWICLDEDDNEFTGGSWVEDTTISRMELMGAIKALSRLLTLRGPSVALVMSDSQYVVLGITHRHRARKKNNDLWDLLDEVVDAHEYVVFDHVKGHDGNYYNEWCDKEASRLRKEGQEQCQSLVKHD